jgi:SNF2 family DNA or RNA helicase
MWAYIRRDKSRCVVVCPSSLVNNWGKEFKKWLGVKCNPLCVGAGIQACETIKTFKSGHISMTPVLIISYEMYRKHCLLINEVREIKLLVCDEAHRLKNIFGTQTTEAFTSLSTCRRLIITGTPIQNNLEELYSLVSFVKPSYLGTRQYFKREYLEPIISCREEGVSLRKKEQGEAALDALHARLAKIMLQRSQDEVLRALLPEKTVYAVVCHMTGAQAAKYETAANELLT